MTTRNNNNDYNSQLNAENNVFKVYSVKEHTSARKNNTAQVFRDVKNVLGSKPTLKATQPTKLEFLSNETKTQKSNTLHKQQAVREPNQTKSNGKHVCCKKSTESFWSYDLTDDEINNIIFFVPDSPKMKSPKFYEEEKFKEEEIQENPYDDVNEVKELSWDIPEYSSPVMSNLNKVSDLNEDNDILPEFDWNRIL